MMISYDVSVNLKTFKESDLFKDLEKRLENTLENFDINEYSGHLWKELSSIDLEIQTKEPFKVYKTDPEAAKVMVSEMLYKFYTIIYFIEPILPETVAKIIKAMQDREMPENGLFPKI
jgi:methionyl-tRNA synthetase